MSLRDRIGVDLGRKVPVEQGIAWAAANDVRHIDAQIDLAPNALGDIRERAPAIRAGCEKHGLHLGLHTLSAVNVAEVSPFMREAVDDYLRAYMDMAVATGAEWVTVHAGYHFTADYERRKKTGLERLERLCDHAQKKNVRLLLENMNPEPRDAEVKYLAHDIEECQYYFGNLASPSLGWSYTINHAHMLPVGIAGFTNELDMGRCGEVRVADNKGDKEEHLRPGEGTIDFSTAFGGIEARGYRGHYMLAFGTLDDIRDGRDWLVANGHPA